ncbi:SPOR domain-containing protein [Aliiroseovarius subalbicans]|uniref:SPOR domain-containing protein n=1 Tax=Aliiroseovarius subalbicans TaxID=2925840 RepID=UPI001F56AB96|nr:SPOR domain-containing protein [Aliiroseovarius subalbicans]MCI2398747.1 SPOR domain-containing protein [Aliiroseovarius subalbicans]
MAQADWGAVQAPNNINTQGTSPATSGSIVSWAGAIMSLGLIVGLGVWGYQLAVRDVSGVPVVRALEGPMRVQPENPGGTSAEHQGLSVNAVQAEGTAAAPADTLTLAPRPVELTAEDTPVDPSANSRVEAAPLVVAEDVAAATEEVVARALSDTSDPVAAALALADAISDGVAPLSNDVNEAVAAAVQAIEQVAPVRVATAVIPASVPGVKTSPIPQRRPANLNTQVVARAASTPASAPVAAASAVQDVDPASLPVGTRLVQLGAFDSQDVARAEWTKLSGRFEDYMGGKSRVIEMAQSGGKTFYRLRALGFEDLSDARRFCSVLMAGKSACIPVVTR